MSLDRKLLAKAKTELDARRTTREAELERRTSEVYLRAPIVREIDSEIRATIRQAINHAISHGSSSEAALNEIKEINLHLQNERIFEIEKAGFPADYLDDGYVCEKCRDTGYNGTEICSCLRDLYIELQRKSLSSLLKLGNESFDSFELRWYDDAPDPKTGISPRMNMENIYELCVIFARRFSPRSPNLLFSGRPGLGKTFLSACIARVVSDNGASVVYDTATSVFATFESARFERGDNVEKARDETRRCLEADLFILDDLGTELTTAFTSSVLYEIINTRLVSNKKTIINTNLTVPELRARYTPQIASRIEGEYQLLSFYGQDIRKLRKELD